jgi:hypothetical protein
MVLFSIVVIFCVIEFDTTKKTTPGDNPMSAARGRDIKFQGTNSKTQRKPVAGSLQTALNPQRPSLSRHYPVNESTLQPFNHSTTQLLNHSTNQPLNYSAIPHTPVAAVARA